jgi:hypothetical protein
MAGTIVANTINTDTGLFTTNNAYSGIANSWVRFNGNGGVTINASFNVSSVTRSGAGIYAITFTTAMTDANYAIVGTGSFPGTSNNYLCPAASPTTAGYGVVTFVNAGATADSNIVSVAIFR